MSLAPDASVTLLNSSTSGAPRSSAVLTPAPAALAFWDRYELPTVALALATYAAWVALVWWHAVIPGVLLFLLGGYVAQLHFSLQHESIHALRRWPRWLRSALVWPPINLWLPYPFYHRSHSTHHVNFYLTHPQRDTESAYHSPPRWATHSKLWRGIYLANQTLAFRLIVGPVLRLIRLVKVEWAFARQGDFKRLGVWLVHAISAAPLLYFVIAIAGMQWWEYVLYFVYPGMMLGALRTFTEHRWGESPHQRTAIVESNIVGGVLYLFSNLHHVHHSHPTMPWYRIPGHFKAHRAALLEGNGNFYYRGYGEIAGRFLLRPVFHPVHPRW